MQLSGWMFAEQAEDLASNLVLQKERRGVWVERKREKERTMGPLALL